MVQEDCLIPHSDKVVVVLGPTASGKSSLAVEIALKFGGEIVSADSVSVYKRLDIGSAKPLPEEMKGVKHHLIDVVSPKSSFSVGDYEELALPIVKDILKRGKLPVICGGTGFYIQALLYDIDFTENDADPAYREKLEKLAREKGAAYLHGLLQERDPKAAEEIHENNVKRVIRALEFYEKTGTPISAHNAAEREKESPYRFAYVVLNRNREELYRRIDLRVDQMMEAGLLEEVKTLREKGYDRSLVSMQGLGYKELLAYLDGECTLEEAIYILKRDTRHFAKRQLTWFKRERDTDWLSLDGKTDEEALADLTEILRRRGVIDR